MSLEIHRIRDISIAAKARLASEGAKPRLASEGADQRERYFDEFNARYERVIKKQIEDAAAKAQDSCEIGFASGEALFVAACELGKMGFHLQRCHSSDRCAKGPCYCETWILCVSWK